MGHPNSNRAGSPPARVPVYPWSRSPCRSTHAASTGWPRMSYRFSPAVPPVRSGVRQRDARADIWRGCAGGSDGDGAREGG